MSSRSLIRHVGTAIAAVRLSQRIEITTLARRIGRSASQVRRIEAGQCEIGVTLLCRIAVALRSPIDALLPNGGR